MGKSKRKALLGVLIIVLLVGSIGLFMKNETNTLNSNSIKEGITKELDDNLIGAYIQQGEEYVKADTIPTSGYEFNAEESYCKIGDVVQEEMTLFYDMGTQSLTVSPIAEEGTKCYLYFDEKASGGDYILAGDNAPTGTTTDWTGGTSYYYTGNPNNWVQFGGFWWRIIRINGDGSIRMIYQGTSANATGIGTQIGTSAFNNSDDNNMYVGYMYGSNSSDYNITHANTYNSTIKGVLDNWYTNNITNKGYGDYVDGYAGFCGDRRVSSGSGVGTSDTYYQSYRRMQNSSPSLSCEDADIYTASGSNSGNKALIHPVGLISADEAMLAGMPDGSSGVSGDNTNNFLYTGEFYWTMSPSWNQSGHARVSYLTSYCGINDNNNFYYVSDILGVRPVINLRSDVEITGSGTSTDPFRVVGA